MANMPKSDRILEEKFCSEINGFCSKKDYIGVNISVPLVWVLAIVRLESKCSLAANAELRASISELRIKAFTHIRRCAKSDKMKCSGTPVRSINFEL